VDKASRTGFSTKFPNQTTGPNDKTFIVWKCLWEHAKNKFSFYKSLGAPASLSRGFESMQPETRADVKGLDDI
jgi:hypothetical protein